MFKIDHDTKVPVLEALHLPYVVISFNDGEELILLLTQESAQRNLEAASADQPTEEVSVVETAIAALNLHPNWAALRQAIKDFPLEERPWPANFSLCDCKPDHVHGYIRDTDDEVLGPESADSLFDGLSHVHWLLDQEKIDSDTAIHLAKQLVELLANNENLE